MATDLASGTQQVIGTHEKPVKSVHYVDELKVCVTGSWDKTLRYWDLRSPQPAMTVKLPERVYSMDIVGQLMTVGMANRRISIFDVSKPDAPFRELISSLKAQTRCVANFPDQTGLVLGSVEGRCGVIHTFPQDPRGNFQFKAHRSDNKTFFVNDIAFHPTGKVATVGSDGVCVYWDKDNKKSTKRWDRLSSPITACAFSPGGELFAYATGYDWSMGKDGYPGNVPCPIIVRGVDPRHFVA